MQNPQEQPKKPSLDVPYRAAQGYATCVTVFLHEGFGKRALLGWPGVIAFVIVWAMSFADPVMGGFFWLWCLAFIGQCIDTQKRLTQGKAISSRYQGFPKLAMKLFRCRKENVARTLEIPLVCGLGMALAYLSEALGVFLIGGGVAMGFVRMMDHQAAYQAVQRIADAQVEAEVMNEYVRGERDDF